ncbi:MAG: twin-arginine translocase TatA/TatE family subunit [Proteobacteria bacterium]|nr:twin-arginine translocase TatA/TatE family subunit [Pseudomonadota bacterium]NCA28677.1 twin-arginine translocase TatA/TatE family subunit [Pseudomonadota bacterium]
MSIGVGELLLILVIVFVLFGAGKLPQVMNDIGKGIKGLKKGLKDEENELNKKNTETKITANPDNTNTKE